jgi:hypothetical protein
MSFAGMTGTLSQKSSQSYSKKVNQSACHLPRIQLLNQPLQRSSYEQREYHHQNKQNMNTLRSILSDIIEVIDILESLKAPKVEKMDRNYYVPKPLSPYTGEYPQCETPAPSEYCDPGPCTPQVSTHYVPLTPDEVLPQQTFRGTGIQLTTLTPDEELPQQSFGGTGVELITLAKAGFAVGNPDQSFPDEMGVTTTPPADEAPVWEKARQAIAQGDPEENAHNAAMFVPEAEPEKKPARKPRAAKAPKPEPVDIGAVRQEVAEVISVMVTEGKKDVIKSILATYGVDRARELPDDMVAGFLNDLRTPLA